MYSKSLLWFHTNNIALYIDVAKVPTPMKGDLPLVWIIDRKLFL